MTTTPSAAPPQRSSSLAALGRESLTYGAGMVLARGLGILLTPILARVFDPSQFGALDLLQTAVMFSSMTLSFQMESALLRYYHEGDDRRALVSTYLISQLATGAAFLVVVVIAGVPLLETYLALDARLAVVSAACSVVAGLVYTHALTLLRAERAVGRAATVIAVNTAMNFAVVCLLLFQFGGSLAAVFAARAISDGACAAGVLWLYRHMYQLRFSRSVLMRYLRFGLPLTPEGFLTFGTAHVGKLILLSYASLADVGLLAVANRIATGLKLILSAMRQAWAPYAFSVAKEAGAHQLYASAFHAYARFGVALLMAFVFLSREVVLVLAGPQYLGARPIVGLIAGAAVISGAMYLFNIGLLLAEKTGYYTLAVLVSSLVGVLSSWVLIAHMGLIGAPLGGTIAVLVLTGLVLYFAQRVYPLPYNARVLMLFVGITLGVSALGFTSVPEAPLAWRVPAVAVAGWIILKSRRVPSLRTNAATAASYPMATPPAREALDEA